MGAAVPRAIGSKGPLMTISLYHDCSEREDADHLRIAEHAPAQSCLPNGGLVSLIEVRADASRAV